MGGRAYKLLLAPYDIYNKGGIYMFLKQKPTTVSLQTSSELSFVVIKLNDKMEAQRRLILLEREDLALLRAYRNELQALTPTLVHVFYEELEKIEEMRAMIQQHSSSDRLRLTLSNHIAEMFEGVLDDTYIHKRLAIAKRHHLIGLQGKWYIAAFQKIFENIVWAIEQEALSSESKIKLIVAVSKIFNFEQQIVLEMFDDEAEKVRREIEAIKFEVTRAVQKASEDLAAMTEEVMANYQVMNDRALEMEKTSDLTTDKLKAMRESSVEGKLAIQKESDALGGIADDLTVSAQHIHELEGLTGEIVVIAEAVKRIANQTNMLSLNAAIEAARAGEQGKGFHVVATEVRQLANQSKESAEQVSNLIQRLTKRMDETSRRVVVTEREMQQSMSRMNGINETFSRISDASELADGQMAQLATDISGMVDVITDLKRATAQIADSSMELNETARRF